MKRREEGVGLGEENNTPATSFKWNDAFWTNMSNDNAKKFSGIRGDGVKQTEDSSSSESSSDDESQNLQNTKLCNKSTGDNSSESDEFTGEIVIERA